MQFLPRIAVVSVAFASCVQASQAQDVKVFYFGNSLTGSSRPEMHSELVQETGMKWTNTDFLGAGWQTWQHRNEVFRALGRPLSAEQSLESKGDLTLDTKPGERANAKAKRFLDGKWDAIVIQLFGSSMDRKTKEMWGQKFEEPINVGDVVAAADLIKVYLEKNPEGRVFIYSVWPPMDPGKVPPDGELPEWAKAMKERTGRIREAEFPDREGFDYEARWSAPYLGDMDEPWKAADAPHWRTRDYTEKVFEGIKARFPDLWEQKRLHHLPGGEVFSELNKKMKAGEFPGLSNITDFYTDVQHIRAGAPCYTVAALFHAGLFHRKPEGLHYAIYNEQHRYGNDPHHDFGEVIEITPERAEIINKTVWDVLQKHPQANLPKQP